jgi:O-antigen/teichoic acid export membrane protein
MPVHWWRSVTAYAAVVTVGTASSAGFLQLSQLFAARAGSGHGAGLFAAAMTLVTPAYLLPRAISVVLFPAMARAAGRADAARVRTQLTVGTQVLAAALLPGFVLAACLSTALVTAFYGSDFAAGGATFAVMAWATWVSIASVPAVNALSSDTGRGYLIPSAASVLGFVLGLVIWLVAGTTIVVVAWGYLIGSVVQSVIPVLAAARRHGGPDWRLGARTLAVAAGGLTIALLVAPAPVLIELAVGVGAAVVAALAVLPEFRSLARLRPRLHAGRSGA